MNVFIDAMESDIEKDRYETYAELETYMDGSASAVGRMMTAVMRPDERGGPAPRDGTGRSVPAFELPAGCS